jgi:hypothetical protein
MEWLPRKHLQPPTHSYQQLSVRIRSCGESESAAQHPEKRNPVFGQDDALEKGLTLKIARHWNTLRKVPPGEAAHLFSAGA